MCARAARKFPPDAGLFDLVIIDEASQCAIPHIVPLLFRARRALIIGDPMQLPHIPGTDPEADAQAATNAGLRAGWLEQRHLSYRRHSAFHASRRATGHAYFLDEHYRCHPDIIRVPNRLFYGNDLIVLTDTRHHVNAGEGPALRWEHVAGHARRDAGRGGSWVNTPEADRVRTLVDGLLATLPDDATIGVISPFKAQQGQLARLCPTNDRVSVGTVHTFQGGEQDVIVLSLVATDGMAHRTVSWLENQPNLWNVAITRARAQLIVVGDQNFWTSRGGVGQELATAQSISGSDPDAHPTMDSSLLRLYQVLSTADLSPQLQVPFGGHVADAVVEAAGRRTAILLDDGVDGGDPCKHLLIQMTRRALLADEQTERVAIRLPAWRLHDDMRSLTHAVTQQMDPLLRTQP